MTNLIGNRANMWGVLMLMAGSWASPANSEPVDNNAVSAYLAQLNAVRKDGVWIDSDSTALVVTRRFNGSIHLKVLTTAYVARPTNQICPGMGYTTFEISTTAAGGVYQWAEAEYSQQTRFSREYMTVNGQTVATARCKHIISSGPFYYDAAPGMEEIISARFADLGPGDSRWIDGVGNISAALGYNFYVMLMTDNYPATSPGWGMAGVRSETSGRSTVSGAWPVSTLGIPEPAGMFPHLMGRLSTPPAQWHLSSVKFDW